MRTSSQNLLNDGVKRREVFGWSMYDFANSGYTTVVLTAVYNAYFVGVVAEGQPHATLLWTVLIALSSLIVMLSMPALGAYADAHAAKKRLLAVSTAGCVISTIGLALAGRGEIWPAAIAVVLSNTFYSYGESLIAAFLPELARREALGRVSGWGWAFGYCGGMLALGLSLAYVLHAQAQGIPATEFVPVTMLITAVLYAWRRCPPFCCCASAHGPRRRGRPARMRPAVCASSGAAGSVPRPIPTFCACWPAAPATRRALRW